jgi:hypothetical protein
VNQASPGSAAMCGERPCKPRLHFIECLNAVFTVLKNCEFQRILRGRINCAEIVAP